LDYNGEQYYPIAIWTYGKVEIQFQWLMNKSPFNDEMKRKELLKQLNQIPGVDLPEKAMIRLPNIFLSTLKTNLHLESYWKLSIVSLSRSNLLEIYKLPTKNYLKSECYLSFIKDNEGGALSDVSEQKDATAFVDGLLKSKYTDLIILSMVILTFLILIIVSATLT
jgi:hypothetical protein